MPPACSVCSHPQTAAIAKDIASGGSNRSVAARFGVSRAAVQRHRVNCLRMPRKAENTPARRSVADGPGSARFASSSMPADPKMLLQRAERLLDDAQTILSRATDAEDDRLALQAVREVRSSLELVMKAHGMLTSEAAITINVDARRAFDAKLADLTAEELRAIAYGKPLPLPVTIEGETC